MTCDYIFFDLDGTLTDPAEGITNSYKYALNFYNLEIPDYATLCSFIGPPLRTIFSDIYHFDEKKTEEAVKVYREYFGSKGLFENQVYPGIEALLQDLIKNGKVLVVATSKPEFYSIQILEKFGLAKYFKKICGSNLDESRSKKMEVIEYALESLQIQDRSKVLMVGDRKFDVEGARECGINTCGVLYGYGSEEELKNAKAYCIAKNIDELRKILL